MKSSFDTDIDVTKSNLVNSKTETPTGEAIETITYDKGYNDDVSITKDFGYTVRKILTQPEANRVFIYTSAEDLVNNVNDLRGFIKEHHEFQVPRLDVLNKYFMGQNISIYEAERRRLDSEKSDVRIANSYAKLITETQVAYITTEPILIKNRNEDKALEEFINSINENNDIDSHNKDLLTDMSVYGRAYEHIYRTEEGDKIGLSDVFNTFIIYDLTIEKKPIAAVRYILLDIEGVEHVMVELYTKESFYVYQPVPFVDDLELTLKSSTKETPNPRLNSYGVIPILEYRNTNRGKGDFEDVIDLIDAYDSTQSDTTNYSTDTPDSLYQITGRLADGAVNSSVARSLKNANMSYLKPAVDSEGKEYSLKGEYVNPTYDVNGIESFKNRLVAEIHKQSKTPNLSDENFGGNQSGIAMKYKLYGIDQSASLKMNEFKRGAKKRYDAVAKLKENVDSEELNFNMNDLLFSFTKNIPINDAEMLDSAVKAGIKLSNETLIDYLPFVNTQQELKRLEAEAESKTQDVTHAH